MLPGDRLVCALIEPLSVAARFKDWPLHVTIVPWFRSDAASVDLSKALERALAAVTPFEAQAGITERFGNDGSKSASLVGPFAAFAGIERRTRQILQEQGAWLADETTRRRRRFSPHVTYQNHGHLKPGDSFRCAELYIIEQKGDCKEVVSKVELGHEQAPA